MNDMLMEYVCEELEEVERDGLKAGNLDSTEKLVSIKKNLLEIEQMEGDGYSMDGGWTAQGSYDGNSYRGGSRRGMHYVRGHYSRDDGTSYRNSYARRDSRGRYSRAEAKESMMEHLEQMLTEAQTEKERKVIEEAMRKMEQV